MGLFDDSNEAAERSSALMEEQLQNNKAELEAKRRSLYETRLGIEKGMGSQQWQPDRSSLSGKPAAPAAEEPKPWSRGRKPAQGGDNINWRGY